MIVSSIKQLRDPSVLVEGNVYYIYGTNWVCYKNTSGSLAGEWEYLGVVAEKVASIKLDNDIVLVMGGREQVDTIMNSVVAAADGVYDNVGQIISVLG